MDNLQSAAQAFAALRFKDRLPSWQEYKMGSPAEQRAIIERWKELSDTKADVTQDWWTLALARYYRAHREHYPVKIKVRSPWWHEDYIQGDYDDSGIGSYAFDTATKGDLGA